ncbi:hypothetical protein [Sphingomonas sp. IC4-52]|uniref:hypothetical protein n=1 Tax=Sphingomonas sp. IC4-52 TaxID=2887202 RepID=UPI001D109995|nr:hypothetical protein [Sphingomonas sp. IC4-52]MCC2980807.1 hypothetical protein [Sphingomonas sp. IC4-52]
MDLQAITARDLHAFWALAAIVALLGCNRTDNTPGNSMGGNKPQDQVIVQDIGDPEIVRDLGFNKVELPDILGLGGEPWQSLVPKEEGGAHTLVADSANVSATFEQSAFGKVVGFRARSGKIGKCGDREAVLRLIDAATTGINPPLILKPSSRSALRYPLVFQGRTSVTTGGISIQTGSDGCIHWIDVRPASY